MLVYLNFERKALSALYLNWTIGLLTSLDHANQLAYFLEATWASLCKHTTRGDTPIWAPKILGRPRDLSYGEYFIMMRSMRCWSDAIGGVARVQERWATLCEVLADPRDP